MHKDIERLVLSKKQIDAKVKEAAVWLDDKFKDATTPPLAISVLRGSVFFACDVVRTMKTAVQLDFLRVSSYGKATESSGEPKIVMDLSDSVEGRDVIIIEDIIDSGHTLRRLRELILGRGASSLTVVALLDKPSRRKVAEKADFVCCEIEDEFVVGYGLDYAEQYRDLPFVGILKRKVYENEK